MLEVVGIELIGEERALAKLGVLVLSFLRVCVELGGASVSFEVGAAACLREELRVFVHWI